MSKYNGYSEKNKAWTMKYMKEKRDSLTLTLPLGTKERYRQYAAAHGYESLTKYIDALIMRDNPTESGVK